MSFLNPLYHAVAFLLVHIYYGLSPVFGKGTGASWALSVVVLTIAMRLVLFPVFVKQIRNMRAMQALQPRMKELQAKYKNDKQKLNQEMMALWKEAGANPFSGCLPLILQIPIFISLFHTLDAIKPSVTNNVASYPTNVAGFPSSLIASAANAKIFGVPIAATFNSSHATLGALHASQTSTRVLCIVLTIIMGATTFITQRQMMARNAANADPSTARQQKILLYVFPVVFLIYGFRFPVGVLLYWLTTNVWSMGQQFFIIRRMERQNTAKAATAADIPLPVGPAVGAKPRSALPAASAPAVADAPAASSPPARPVRPTRPPGRRPAGRKSTKRGGRR